MKDAAGWIVGIAIVYVILAAVCFVITYGLAGAAFSFVIDDYQWPAFLVALVVAIAFPAKVLLAGGLSEWRARQARRR